jgi:hypothetical protein
MKNINVSFLKAMFFLLTFTLYPISQDLSHNLTNDISAAGNNPAELTSGLWVLTGVEQKVFNKTGVTKWEIIAGELSGLCQWKDVIDVIHTVNASFKWKEPPIYLKPGSASEFEASYINKEYSTTTNLRTGMVVYFDEVKPNYYKKGIGALDVMNISKYNKYYTSEDKKNIFNAPKYFFGNSNECRLIVDCYVAEDHFITIYTYRYEP